MKWDYFHRARWWRPWHWLALAGLAVPAAAPRALALNPAEAPTNYIAAHWDTEDGLPHNLVKCIFQTRDGYLWVGTQQGLARFDGQTFTVFNQHNTPALQNNIITSLAETRDGSLWIGTSFGLTRYQDGQFTAYGRTNGLKADTVNGLCVVPDGSLWIGGREGITRWVNDKFVNDVDTSAFDMLGTRFLGMDRHSNLWIAAGFDALCYHDGKFTHFGRPEGLPAQPLRMLREDAAGGMIAVTYGGLRRLQNGRFVPFEQGKALSSQRVDATLADQAGNLWIGSFGGLDRFSGGQLVPYTESNGDKLAGVSALFEDREHCLWVGTSDGLYRLTDRRASLLHLENGATETMVNTLIRSRDGALWIAEWGKGVDRLQNGITTHYTAGAPLSSEPVTAFFEAADGTMWLGTRGSSLDRLDGNKVTSFVYQSGVVSARSVTVIYQDSDGEFLVGISRRGLLQFSEGKLTPVPGASGLAGDTVWTLKRTRDGRLLMGTDKGLYQRNPDRTWKLVALGGQTNVIGARALLEEDNGAIWIATEGAGLVRWQNGQETAYTSRDGMLDDVLFSVLDDHHGSLWLNSARGIGRISKSEFAKMDRGEAIGLNCLTFGRGDGLLSASTSGNGTLSALCLPDGSLLAATDKGVVVIDPRRVQINNQPPPVVIESVVVDDQRLAQHHEVLVPAGAYRLEINYSALSLVAPQKLQFRYQLAGSDPHWIDAGGQRQASYTHLSPGHYTFRVLACNNDGVWNETGASLKIQVQPHFYQTRSFIGLAVTVTAATLFAVYHVRKRNARRQMAVLEELVDRRTSELKSAKESAEAAVHTKNEFIAALKQAEVEREDLHNQLLETSRQAGMAEVATSVLHNVGNVLNSVNVSTTLIMETLQKSKIRNLGRLATLIQEHQDNLPDFFLSDPKGKELPDYIARLADHLSGEQANLLKETALTRNHIEHIKDIVTMQQSYAKVLGVVEKIAAVDLVEDALRLNGGALVRHDVRVFRDFPAQPVEINVERQKVLQILVNLIRNAKYACDESGRTVKQLTMQVRNADGRVQIIVKDNGVGIAAENMTRIFNHGFTTRAEGHGFGLHSAALAAKEMGGTLSAQSDGPDRGASFTLDLPLQPAATL